MTGMGSHLRSKPETLWQDSTVVAVVIVFPLLALGSAVIGYFSYLEGCDSPQGCAPWWKVLLGSLVFEGTLIAIPIVLIWWKRRKLQRRSPRAAFRTDGAPQGPPRA